MSYSVYPVACRCLVVAALLVTSFLLRPPLAAVAVDGPDNNSGQAAAQGDLTQSRTFPSFAAIAQVATPAVVNIATTEKAKASGRTAPAPRRGPSPFGDEESMEEFFRRFFGERTPPRRQRGLGSGFVISSDGYVVTNNHVIEGADTVTVRLAGKEEYKAKVIGSDDKTDLALLKIEAPRPLPTLPLGNSTNLQVGDWVLAIGNPFGLQETVTAGIVSAKGRVIGAGPYDDFIQTDASINPGNSGGPLLNLQGEVVGINSAIFSQSGGNVGIGFAIPVDLAKTILTQLREKGQVTRGWLGVSIQNVTPELAKSFGLNEATGALVAEVTPDGPAAKAGVERGDIIRSFDGVAIANAQTLPALVAQTPVNKRVNLTVIRKGAEQTLTVTVGELRNPASNTEAGSEVSNTLGLTVAEITTETQRLFNLEEGARGVVVIDVAPDSSAEQGGLRAGDIIEEVNRKATNSVEAFQQAVVAAQQQETILLLVRRGDQRTFMVLRQTK